MFTFGKYGFVFFLLLFSIMMGLVMYCTFSGYIVLALFCGLILPIGLEIDCKIGARIDRQKMDNLIHGEPSD